MNELIIETYEPTVSFVQLLISVEKKLIGTWYTNKCVQDVIVFGLKVI